MNWSDTVARLSFVDSEARRAMSAVADREELHSLVTAAAFKTESPIEAQFAAWFDVARGRLLSLGQTRFALHLRPQHWVDVSGSRYRLDFALEPLDPWLRGALLAEHLEMRVGVELDGHDYHEKTREQVTTRNQRDRDLAAARWTLLHFSGTELHQNPMIAVVEVLSAGADALDQAKAALFHG